MNKQARQPDPSADALTLLKKSIHELETQLEKIPAHYWQAKPLAQGKWSLAEIVHHLILVEVQGLQSLIEMANGSTVDAGGDARNRPNIEQFFSARRKLKTISAYEPTSGIPAKYLLEALRRARRETVASVQKIGGARLSQIAIDTHWLGPVTGIEYAICLAYHMRRHAEQIQRLISRNR